MSNQNCQRHLPDRYEGTVGPRALQSVFRPALAATVLVVDLLTRIAAALLISLVRLYRLALSPLLGPCCRFHPTCSAYAIEAIRQHGPLRGTRRALSRLARCHPWSEGGFDPVR
jgi:putative membrane protein insertion efficiency factor